MDGERNNGRDTQHAHVAIHVCTPLRRAVGRGEQPTNPSILRLDPDSECGGVRRHRGQARRTPNVGSGMRERLDMAQKRRLVEVESGAGALAPGRVGVGRAFWKKYI